MSSQFTLYVAHDRTRPHRHDVGSVLCLKTVRNLPRGVVTIVECTGAHAARPPSFVRGTPTLVDDTTGQTTTGHDAVHRLHLAALFYAEQHGVERGRREGAHKCSGGGQVVSARASALATVEEEVEDSSLWTSQIQEEDPADDISDRKLTSDDFARAIADRRPVPSQGTTGQPPPPPPPLRD